MNTTYILPWPPSVNSYYRAIQRGDHAVNILSKPGRLYQQALNAAVGFVHPKTTLRGRVAVTIILEPPSAHRRDIDNHCKAILDGLTKAGVWKDDSQVDFLTITRGEKFKGGRAIVTVWEVSNAT